MTSERIEPGAEQAHRDVPGEVVARLWMASKPKGDGVTDDSAAIRARQWLPHDLIAALDRLADAYDFNAGER